MVVIDSFSPKPRLGNVVVLLGQKGQLLWGLGFQKDNYIGGSLCAPPAARSCFSGGAERSGDRRVQTVPFCTTAHAPIGRARDKTPKPTVTQPPRA